MKIWICERKSLSSKAIARDETGKSEKQMDVKSLLKWSFSSPRRESAD